MPANAMPLKNCLWWSCSHPGTVPLMKRFSKMVEADFCLFAAVSACITVSLVPKGGVGRSWFCCSFCRGVWPKGSPWSRTVPWLRQHHFQNLSPNQQHIRNYYTPLNLSKEWTPGPGPMYEHEAAKLCKKKKGVGGYRIRTAAAAARGECMQGTELPGVRNFKSETKPWISD